MKPVEWYVTRYNQIMSTLLKLGKNFGDTRHPYDKMNPPSIILGGGGGAR